MMKKVSPRVRRMARNRSFHQGRDCVALKALLSEVMTAPIPEEEAQITTRKLKLSKPCCRCRIISYEVFLTSTKACGGSTLSIKLSHRSSSLKSGECASNPVSRISSGKSEKSQ